MCVRACVRGFFVKGPSYVSKGGADFLDIGLDGKTEMWLLTEKCVFIQSLVNTNKIHKTWRYKSTTENNKSKYFICV